MCSYCGCQSIDVIGRFTAEHEQIINAAGELRRTVEAGRHAGLEVTVAQRVDALAALLTPHTGAEEAGLFFVLRRDADFTDYVDSLCGEHVTLDDALARIRAGEHDLVASFYRQLRTHIEREEDGLFPSSLTALGGPDWAEVDALTAAAVPVSPVADR